MSYTPRLKKKYKEQIVSNLISEFEYSSPMQAPKLEKVCLNQGIGRAVADKKLIDQALEEMTLITGHRRGKRCAPRARAYAEIYAGSSATVFCAVSSKR